MMEWVMWEWHKDPMFWVVFLGALLAEIAYFANRWSCWTYDYRAKVGEAIREQTEPLYKKITRLDKRVKKLEKLEGRIHELERKK